MPRISQDDWEEWMAHPITEAVMEWAREQGESQRDGWLRVSWGGGQVDPITLARMQGRAEAYQDVATVERQQVAEDS